MITPNSFTDRAAELGQDLRKREFKDQSWLGLKTRSRDATLSRHKGININELYLHTKLDGSSPTGETWRGKWQGNEIAAKILGVRECTPRISRDFNEEYPKLRSVVARHLPVNGFDLIPFNYGINVAESSLTRT
jgi:integrin-linked kinase